jgi:thioredoxin 1
MLAPYTDTAPDHDILGAIPGPVILEFGSNACGICQAATPLIAQALATNTVPHLRVQDGKGRRLGRQYGVKLWPTLILLRDGKEVGRVVRPTDLKDLLDALKLLED